MDNAKKTELKVELTPEVAAGHYSNFAVIAHSANEFFIDFVAVAPNMPQAKVQSRIIMTPETPRTCSSPCATTSPNMRPHSAKSNTKPRKTTRATTAETSPILSWPDTDRQYLLTNR